jgi:hypothetical protein
MADAAPVTPKSDLQKALAWVKALKKGWVIIAIIIVTLLWSVIGLTSRSSADGKSEKVDLKEMIDNLNYQHSVTIGITEEAFRPAGQQFCGEGVRPGKWQFVFPREAELEKWHKQESGFRTINPDGSTNTPQSFISRVRINKVMSGEERVVIGDDDCFRVFIKAPPGAVMLGNPVFYNGKAVPFGPDSEPKPAIVTIRFFG